MFIANNNNNNSHYKVVQFTCIQYKIIMAIKKTEGKNMPCLVSVKKQDICFDWK